MLLNREISLQVEMDVDVHDDDISRGISANSAPASMATVLEKLRLR